MQETAGLAKELFAQPAKIMVAGLSLDKWRTLKKRDKNIGKVDICIQKIDHLQQALHLKFLELSDVKDQVTDQERNQFLSDEETLTQKIKDYVDLAEEQKGQVPDLGPIREELEKKREKLAKLYKFVRKCEKKEISLRFKRVAGALKVLASTDMGTEEKASDWGDFESELTALEQTIKEIEQPSS